MYAIAKVKRKQMSGVRNIAGYEGGKGIEKCYH